MIVLSLGILFIANTFISPKSATGTFASAGATSEPEPQWLTGPTFGGIETAFTAKYGQPAPNGIYTTKIGSHAVRFFLETQLGADNAEHVSQISLFFDGTGFSERDADQLITPLLPPDATGNGTHETAASFAISFASSAIASVFPESKGDFEVICERDNPDTQQTKCTYEMIA